jgi:hypothetical protein
VAVEYRSTYARTSSMSYDLKSPVTNLGGELIGMIGARIVDENYVVNEAWDRFYDAHNRKFFVAGGNDH